MRQALGVLAVVVLIGLVPGCFYANIKIPLDTDLQQTTLGSKIGQASTESILGLVAWGDASTQAAAEDGGLSTINHMDQEIFAVLGFVYVRQTVIVYGD